MVPMPNMAEVVAQEQVVLLQPLLAWEVHHYMPEVPEAVVVERIPLVDVAETGVLMKQAA